MAVSKLGVLVSSPPEHLSALGKDHNRVTSCLKSLYLESLLLDELGDDLDFGRVEAESEEIVAVNGSVSPDVYLVILGHCN